MRNANLYRGGSKIAVAQERALGLGATISSTATRIDKSFAFYTVGELRSDTIDCSHVNHDPLDGSLLLQSDLRLREWLSDVALAKSTGDLPFIRKSTPPFNQNAISHEIKFEVVSSGNITPSWKLVDIAANQAGSPLFGGSRDRNPRSHDHVGSDGAGSDEPHVEAPARAAGCRRCEQLRHRHERQHRSEECLPAVRPAFTKRSGHGET